MHRTEKNTERGRAGQPVEGGRATQTREPACLRQPCRFLAAALAAPCAPLRAPARSRGALVTPSLHQRGLERVTRRASTLRRPNENAQRSKHRRGGVAAATSARRTRRRARVGHHAGTRSAGRAAQQGLAAPGGRAARSARSSKALRQRNMRRCVRDVMHQSDCLTVLALRSVRKSSPQLPARTRRRAAGCRATGQARGLSLAGSPRAHVGEDSAARALGRALFQATCARCFSRSAAAWPCGRA